jgi:hypothetical protein
MAKVGGDILAQMEYKQVNKSVGVGVLVQEVAHHTRRRFPFLFD